MTAANYTTDLTTLSIAGETVTNWSGFGYVSPAVDADAYIQGSNCISSTAKSTGLGGALYNATSGQTIPTDGAFLAWGQYSFMMDVATEAAGGFRLFIGSGTTAYKHWYVSGSDTHPYGGWRNYACNPTVAADANTGSPTATLQYFGFGANLTISTTKGTPFAVDAYRFGRCEARFVGGTSPDSPCTFAGFAANNDLPANRWGLIQSTQGVYLWKGLMVIGYGAACRFTDSGVSVSIENTKKVTANFNTIEVRNTSTEVNWTAVNFTALGNVSPGRWVTTDNANVNLIQCSFTGMNTFSFMANANITGCTFRNCGQITLANSHLTSSLVTGSTVATNTSAVVWNNNLNTSGFLDGSTFVRGTANNHAIEFGTSSPTSFELVGVTFTGYNAGNNLDDSAIHIKRSSGTVTVTITGGSTPSYSSAGAVVEFVTSSVNATVYTKDIDGNNVDGARVLLKAAAGGPMPYDVTVTITNSGTTANVAHTSHGLLTNDKVMINGASHWQNNGVFTITKINDNAYNYTLPSAPGSDPTGTIKATYVALEGLTSSGMITMSRAFSSDQPVNGWARKSSSAPYYKPAPLTGSIDSALGFSATAVMILDQ